MDIRIIFIIISDGCFKPVVEKWYLGQHIKGIIDYHSILQFLQKSPLLKDTVDDDPQDNGQGSKS